MAQQRSGSFDAIYSAFNTAIQAIATLPHPFHRVLAALDTWDTIWLASSCFTIVAYGTIHILQRHDVVVPRYILVPICCSGIVTQAGLVAVGTVLVGRGSNQIVSATANVLFGVVPELISLILLARVQSSEMLAPMLVDDVASKELLLFGIAILISLLPPPAGNVQSLHFRTGSIVFYTGVQFGFAALASLIRGVSTPTVRFWLNSVAAIVWACATMAKLWEHLEAGYTTLSHSATAHESHWSRSVLVEPAAYDELVGQQLAQHSVLPLLVGGIIVMATATSAGYCMQHTLTNSLQSHGTPFGTMGTAIVFATLTNAVAHGSVVILLVRGFPPGLAAQISVESGFAVLGLVAPIVSEVALAYGAEVLDWDFRLTPILLTALSMLPLYYLAQRSRLATCIAGLCGVLLYTGWFGTIVGLRA